MLYIYMLCNSVYTRGKWKRFEWRADPRAYMNLSALRTYILVEKRVPDSYKWPDGGVTRAHPFVVSPRQKKKNRRNNLRVRVGGFQNCVYWNRVYTRILHACARQRSARMYEREQIIIIIIRKKTYTQ